MRERRLGLLAAALAAACFEDPIKVEGTAGMDGTASDTGTTGSELTAMATGPVTDTEPPTTTTEPPPTSTSVDGTATSEGSSSTGEPIPIECGDGMAAPGELCFEDSTVLMANDSTFSARIGDVSGMPARDVVHLITDQVVVRVGSGDGNFGPAVFDASVVGPRFELADFDGDGELDMALAETSGMLHLLLGSGAGSFSSADQVPMDGVPQALAVAHLDANAGLDVVVGSGTTVYTALGDGAGGLAGGPSFSGVGAVTGLALADLDGDDRTDLVLTVDGGGRQGVALRRGGGDGTFEEQEATTGTMPGARGIATGDFDGDGVLDVAYASHAMDAIGVLLGTGGGSFETEMVVATGSDPQVLHAADLDADGHTELVVGHQGETTLRIFTVASDGTVTEALQIPLAAAVTALDSGDVNGDGVPDLAATSTAAEIVTMVLSTP